MEAFMERKHKVRAMPFANLRNTAFMCTYFFLFKAYFLNQLGGIIRNGMNNVILPNIQQHDMQNRHQPLNHQEEQYQQQQEESNVILPNIQNHPQHHQEEQIQQQQAARMHPPPLPRRNNQQQNNRQHQYNLIPRL